MRRSTFWLLLATVTAFFVFIASAGHFFPWPQWSAVADSQAEGFRAGHLYAAVAEGRGHWDYSRYQGHWYTYWGLYPAMGLAVVKTVLRMNVTVGDEVMTFLFLVGRAIAGGLLITAMARRLRPAPPPRASGLALVMFAVASPTTFMLARAAVYESAIAAGSCFLTLGIWLAFEGMFADRAPSSWRADRWLAGAGFAFGLASGSRANLLPLVAVASALTILARWRLDGGTGRRLVGLGVVLGGPIAVLTAVQLLLNKLRFGEWLEFGSHYQVGIVLKTGLMGVRFLPANLFLYLFQRPDLSCRFPYVLAAWNRSRELAPGFIFAGDYRATEPTIGLLMAIPFLWFGLAGIALGLLRPAADASLDRPRWRWLGAVLTAGVVVGALPVLYMVGPTMRYEADFASCLLLIAFIGAWRLLAAPWSRRGRTALVAIGVAASALTIVMGMLLGFVGYFDHFQRNNPILAARMSRAFDLCGAPAAPAPPALKNSAGKK